MGQYYWDGKIDYLRRSTGLYYNDDYIEFLVKTVWRVDRPVHVMDFGCGFGHMGIRLLPLLPKGSKYTGVDVGEKLIEHARELFEDSPYETEFILGDIQTMVFEQKYDIALCHAVMLHMPNPKDVLRKMMGSVIDHGKIVCFEPNWIANMASYHFEGMQQSSAIQLGLLQKLYEMDANRSGKDGNIGFKLPVYFSQLGLTEIQCRMSDKVNFHDPLSDRETAAKLFRDLQFDHPGEREPFIQQLVERGLSLEEAESEYETEMYLSQSLTEPMLFTYAPSMKITFGTVIFSDHLD